MFWPNERASLFQIKLVSIFVVRLKGMRPLRLGLAEYRTNAVGQQSLLCCMPSPVIIKKPKDFVIDRLTSLLTVREHPN